MNGIPDVDTPRIIYVACVHTRGEFAVEHVVEDENRIRHVDAAAEIRVAANEQARGPRPHGRPSPLKPGQDTPRPRDGKDVVQGWIADTVPHWLRKRATCGPKAVKYCIIAMPVLTNAKL